MKKAILSLLVLPLLALGGCYSTYAADVRNRTGQPMSVELLARDGPDRLVSLAPSMRLGPGDRGGIGPVTVDQQRLVLLRADTPGNPGHPVILDLRPGTTVAEVTQDNDSSNTPVRVREVPR